MLASAQEWLHAKSWSVPHIMKQGSVVRFIVSCLLIDRRLPTKLQVKNSLIFFQVFLLPLPTRWRQMLISLLVFFKKNISGLIFFTFVSSAVSSQLAEFKILSMTGIWTADLWCWKQPLRRLTCIFIDLYILLYCLPAFCLADFFIKQNTYLMGRVRVIPCLSIAEAVWILFSKVFALKLIFCFWIFSSYWKFGWRRRCRRSRVGLSRWSLREWSVFMQNACSRCYKAITSLAS